MDSNAFMEKALPQIPPDIQTAIAAKAPVTRTAFDKKDDILTDEILQREVGFSRFDNGNYLVSMTCPMPGITPEMIRWWFWWHAQESIRYKVWFPGEHFGISYARKDRAYFSEERLPTFQPNTHYPVERIGKLILPLKIEFVSPEAFGFSPDLMQQNGIPLIICGHVGAMYGLVPHTEMAHIFKQTKDGLLLISRFWLGQTLQNPLLRKIILTDETASGMAKHCCVEYRNLAEILPELYRTESK